MSMVFPFGQTVFRDRRGLVDDKFNTAKQVAGDFDPELTIELPGAYLAPGSSSQSGSATRSEILTSASLYLGDVTADVVSGDRIRAGGTKDDLDSGTAYTVESRPFAETNPFTGWTPVVAIPLTLVEG